MLHAVKQIIRRPYDDEVVLTRCFRPVDEASITHVFVEPGSWVATQLPMGRYELLVMHVENL